MSNRIDRIKLAKMLQTKSAAECAKHFNVSEAAISKARKVLSSNIVKVTGLEEAHRVVQSHLNVVEQLQKINSNANEILDSLMKWGQGDSKALPILESQVKKVLGPGKELKEWKYKDPRELALRAMSEIRSQLALQLDLFKSLYDIRQVNEFQKEVLEAIGEVDPLVRQKIISRLKEKRILRASVTISHTGI
jgi:hypothetical protein